MKCYRLGGITITDAAALIGIALLCVVVACAELWHAGSVLPCFPALLPLRCASACAFTTTKKALRLYRLASRD
ncbi:hypothetical protein ACNR8R_004135 [Enterobacter roggenkampii]